MTVQQDQLVAYLRSHPCLQPYVRAAGLGAWPQQALRSFPTTEEFAAELLADAEFRALGLGMWLRTTDGQIVSEAVGQVIPPEYEPIFTLTVDALKLAAAEHTTEGRRRASGIALVAIVGGICIQAAIRSS